MKRATARHVWRSDGAIGAGFKPASTMTSAGALSLSSATAGNIPYP